MTKTSFKIKTTGRERKVDDKTFINDVACLITAMREIGVTPEAEPGKGFWWEQEFAAVERELVRRGLISRMTK